MARYPKAVWQGPLPTSNYAPGPSPKIGIVHHVIVGSESSADGEFHGPGAQLSAHFIVAGPGDTDPDGTVIQLLDTDDDCYAQEAGNYPPTAYIAVETSGITTTPLSPAQCESLAQLDAWASETHGFPLNGPVPHGTPGVTGHCNPDGTPDPAWGNHPCPGPIRLAQIPGIIARARALSIPVPPKPPAPVFQGEPRMFDRDPVSNGLIGTDRDGNLYCDPAVLARGLHIVTLPEHPDWKAGWDESWSADPCVGVMFEKDMDGTWGYTYLTQPVSGKGSWGIYNRYHINANGTF